MLKVDDSLTKSNNDVSNPDITYYKCIRCSQIICHDERYVDRKGKVIPLDGRGKNRHQCLIEDYGGVR